MTKCDFCTRSSPDGKCFWSSFSARQSDCKKAIELMVEVLKGNEKGNEKGRWKRWQRN